MKTNDVDVQFFIHFCTLCFCVHVCNTDILHDQLSCILYMYMVLLLVVPKASTLLALAMAGKKKKKVSLSSGKGSRQAVA